MSPTYEYYQKRKEERARNGGSEGGGSMKYKDLVVENRVKEVCRAKGIDRQEFIGMCLTSKATYQGRRLKLDVVQKAYDGDIGLTLGTAVMVAEVLGVGLEEIFKIGE